MVCSRSPSKNGHELIAGNFSSAAFVYFWMELAALIWVLYTQHRRRPHKYSTIARNDLLETIAHQKQTSAELISFKLYLLLALKRRVLSFLLNGIITFQLQLNLTHTPHADVGIRSLRTSRWKHFCPRLEHVIEREIIFLAAPLQCHSSGLSSSTIII